jgi:hypothetical protein
MDRYRPYQDLRGCRYDPKLPNDLTFKDLHGSWIEHADIAPLWLRGADVEQCKLVRRKPNVNRHYKH